MEGLGVDAWQYVMGSSWRRMTGDTELVSIWVSEVCAIVVLVIFRPQAWRSLRGATVCERYSIRALNDVATFREEGHHLPIALVVRLVIVGFANEKEGSWIGMRVPASPRATSFAEAGFYSKRGHQWVIESQSAVEVADPNEDV